MAQIQSNVTENIFTVRRFRGVNEAEEGEASLKTGEAAVCRNFRVTDGGALKKRGGTMNVVTLATDFIIEEKGAADTVTEYGESTGSFTLYPRISVSNDGGISVVGTDESVGYSESETHEGWYMPQGDGVIRFYGCAYTEREHVVDRPAKFAGGNPSSWDRQMSTYVYCWFLVCDSVMWDGETWTLTGAEIVHNNSDELYDGNKYTVLTDSGGVIYFFATEGNKPALADFETRFSTNGRFAKLKTDDSADNYFSINENPLWRHWLIAEEYSEARWDWSFTELEAVPNPETETQVRALWSGFVMGREVICAAANGILWELTLENGSWSRASCGTLSTDGSVFMFGFEGKLYILNGAEYKVWDGSSFSDVEGYRPLVTVSNVPEGGGMTLEQVNKLNGLRRAWFSPDGTAKVFKLTEKNISSVDWVKSMVTGEYLTGWTYDLAAGTVTLPSAPAAGVNTLEIAWTYPVNYRSSVTSMRYAELFNGSQDTRVFIYGDGSNEAFYSGLDYNGKARADYFPDLNECAVGDENTPITAMIRHYSRLLCFKKDSTWSIAYGTITLSDGAVTAGFYVSPVNRDVGSCAYGEARLCENRPRTLDGGSVIEWRASSGGNLTDDQRNAERISQRVSATLGGFELESARTFYDKTAHEYYVIGADGTAIVQNLDADAWYIYTNFPATAMISYLGEKYYGTKDGYLRHFSEEYYSDEGEAIDARWESGAMDFSEDFRRKYSAMIWVGVKPEENGRLDASCETDRKTDFASYTVTAPEGGAVPEMRRIKLKAKKFTYYKLIFSNGSADTTATVVSADVRVRGTGYVR